jgi:cytochrome c553
MPRFTDLFLAATLCGFAIGVGAAQAQTVRRPMGVEACAPCHGLDGIAKDVEVPHLAGQNVVYLLNQMKAFRSGARKHKEMRWMSRHMTSEELEALAIYYAALPRI